MNTNHTFRVEATTDPKFEIKNVYIKIAEKAKWRASSKLDAKIH
jgi:hypothetical protein